MSATSAYQVALITGAASGIGRELARLLAVAGTSVAGVDLRPEGLAALADELDRQRFAWTVADVTDAAALRNAVVYLEKQLGPVDLLIASAGIGVETSALNLSADDMAAVIAVNLVGVSNSVAAVLPGMIQRQRGHLVAISSLASYSGLPRMLGYCASKSGVNALMEGLRLELNPQGISVTTICPGWVRTPMTAPIGGRLPKMLEVDEAARRIYWAIQRKKTFYAFPASMVWQMRLLRLFPRRIRDRVIRRMMQRMASHS